MQQINWPALPSPESDPDFFDELIRETRDSPMSPYGGVLEEFKWQQWNDALRVQVSFEITIRQGCAPNEMLVDFSVFFDLCVWKQGERISSGVLAMSGETATGLMLFDRAKVQCFEDLSEAAKDEVLRCLEQVYKTAQENSNLLIAHLVGNA